MTLPAWLSHEPSAWAGAIAALLEIVVLFGVHIDDNQKAAIMGAIPIIAAVFVRQNVTPNAKLAPDAQKVVVDVPAPPAPGAQ